ncbi:hypothetical protein ONS95_015023 [Cadophora gregata]|uniref:uncharacterized protein n=1 Tax=Cadophora gregata TaxID=51156 RepID=UPI0026DB27E3|nr:uncharacterized protein ONS95_015023 [Cadophora gregata]KAK0108437.1 hypothetical protein ONS95_015023 [Cadophora gregata]KAK0108970.1 hypothetical protein ONS96_002808 [Cadophora gregata f. sp. sojae]
MESGMKYRERTLRLDLQRRVCEDGNGAIADAWIFDVVESGPQKGLHLAIALVPQEHRAGEEEEALIVETAREALKKALDNLPLSAAFPAIDDWRWLVLPRLPSSKTGGVDKHLLGQSLYEKETQHANGHAFPDVSEDEATLAIVSPHQYWNDQLCDAKPPSFPRLKPGSMLRRRTSNGMRRVKKSSSFPLQPNGKSAMDRNTLVRAAWAIVLARYSESDDVCFGAQVFSMDKVASPNTATIVPIRVRIDQRSTTKSFLQSVLAQAVEMMHYEQFGLQNISKVNRDAEVVCNFSSVLIVRPLDLSEKLDRRPETNLEDKTDEYELSCDEVDYPLLLQCIFLDGAIDLCALYDPRAIAELQIVALFNHLGQVIKQLQYPSRNGTLVSEISLDGPWDVQQALFWNCRETPEIVDSCLHVLIAKQAEVQPHILAIDAWDGKLTYSELEFAANRLAHHLTGAGVVIESLVHVCFEKSIWYYVAILAVNKAGGAWVPLDPSHPIERQQQVVQQTAARLALASPTNSRMCASLGLVVVTIDETFDKALRDEVPVNVSLLPNPTLSSRNAAFVIFTSGSTGTPQGFVIEHQSLCTSQKAVCKRMKMTSDVRMLHFASHVFDASICESLFPLMLGACVCVPSDYDRINALPGFIRDKNITWASLIPSFLRTLKPYQVPGLQALIVGGEALSRDLLEVWCGRLRLINVWGPAECCPISSVHEWSFAKESTLTIGRSS